MKTQNNGNKTFVKLSRLKFDVIDSNPDILINSNKVNKAMATKQQTKQPNQVSSVDVKVDVNNKTNTAEVEDIEITLETLHLYKESGYDPTSRSIFIWGEIDEEASHHFITSVVSILRINPSQESIKLYINSPGGDIYDMFSIIDYMNYINSKLNVKVDVIATGRLMSAAAFITIVATGKRYMFPNCTMLLHEIQSFSPYDNTTNKKEDLQHTVDLENKIIDMISNKTKKKKPDFWKKEIERKDRIYYPKEALGLGLIDGILE